MKDIRLDGNKIVNKETFYEEIESKLASRLDFVMEQNLESLIDVLDVGLKNGGEREPMHISWDNYSASKENVPETFMSVVLEIFDMFESKDLSYDLND